MSTPTMSATIAKPPVLVEGVTPPGRVATSNRLLIIFCFFAIYTIWGSTYLAIRYAVETIPPLYAAGIRHLASGTILLLWCFAKKVRPTASQIRSGVVLGVLFFLLGHGPLHWAETRVPSGLASLLVATEPIFVFFLAALAATSLLAQGDRAGARDALARPDAISEDRPEAWITLASW